MTKEIALKILWDSCIHNEETKEAYEILKNDTRPQGKWKFSRGVTTQGSLKCSCCDYRDYHITNSNFCPNCGANMRKGGRNENIN